MASLWPLSTLLLLFLAYPASSLAFQYEGLKLKTSEISAAPSLLPSNPQPSVSSPSPSMPPDISPLLPTPKNGDEGSSPVESSSLPTIPATPSPPNPDHNIDPPFASGPDEMAFPPTGPLPASSSVSLHLSVPSNLSLFLLGVLAVLGMCSTH